MLRAGRARGARDVPVRRVRGARRVRPAWRHGGSRGHQASDRPVCAAGEHVPAGRQHGRWRRV